MEIFSAALLPPQSTSSPSSSVGSASAPQVCTEEVDGPGYDRSGREGSRAVCILDVCIQQVQSFIVPCVVVDILHEVGESGRERSLIKVHGDEGLGVFGL